MSSISQILASAILSRPDCVVFSGPQGDITWRQLDLSSNRLITVIENSGRRSSVRYLIVAVPMGELFLASVIAAIKLGIAYIPISSSMVESLDLDAIGCSSSAAFVVDVSTTELMERCSQPGHYSFGERSSKDPLYGVMTSGTTGVPKIPLLPRKTIEVLSQAFAERLGEEGLVWSAIHVTTFGFSTLEYFMPMLLKGRIVVPSDPGGLMNGPRMLAHALKKRLCCDVVCLTPSGFQLFLVEAQTLQIQALPRFIILSGEDLSGQLLQRWFDSPWCTTTEVISTYASAEAGGQVFWKQMTAESAAKDLGTPLPHVLPMLLNDDDTIITKPGIGRLALVTEASMIGYLNSESQKYVEVKSGAKTYSALLSDDMIERREDGSWHYVGRVGSLVKHHGKFVDLDRISDLVLEAFGFQHVKTRQVEMEDGRKRLISFGAKSLSSKIELWPALGEFNQYDRYTYGIMAQEGAITSRFIQAVQDSSVGRAVLDIGCGSDLLISRLAAAAKASSVVAFEIDDEAAALATTTANDLEFNDIIKVLCADVAVLEESIDADVAITRIFGNIASADGVIPVVRNLNRISKRPLTWLPGIARTKVGAIDLGPLTADRFSIGVDSEQFFLKVERRLRKDYRGRVCIRNFSPSQIISDTADFEVLNFSEDAYVLADSINLLVEREALFSGLVLWVQTESGDCVFDDFLSAQKGWLPVYLPTCLDPVPVMPGDCINLKIESPDYMATNPDYHFDITISRNGHICHRSQFDSEHFSSKPQAWHEQISRIRNSNDPRLQKLSRDMTLQHWRQIIGGEEPLPDQVLLIDHIPLTANGKTDYAALESLALRETLNPVGPDAVQGDLVQVSKDSLRTLCMDVFRQCLTTEVDATSDVFQLGASSLDLASIATLLTSRLGRSVPISLVYDAPTAQLLSDRLYSNYFEGAASPSAQSTAVTAMDRHGDEPSHDSSASVAPIDRFDLQLFRDACQQLRVEPPVSSAASSQPVYLLAPPGSGQAWLRLMLAANPEIFVAPELQLLNFTRLSEWQRQYQGSLAYQNALADLAFSVGLELPSAIDSKSSPGSSQDLLIEDLYGALLSRQAGSGLYVETSTSYGLYPSVLERLKALYPNCRIIHLVRDPSDCIASSDIMLPACYPHLPLEDYDRPQLLELLWFQTHRNILRFFSDLGPRQYLRISHASLLANPSHVLSDLCAFLGTAPIRLWQTDVALTTGYPVLETGFMSVTSSASGSSHQLAQEISGLDHDSRHDPSYQLSDFARTLYERLQG